MTTVWTNSNLECAKPTTEYDSLSICFEKRETQIYIDTNNANFTL